MIKAFKIVEALLSFEPQKQSLREDHQAARPVIYRDKVIKDGTLICPHCNNEIGEKATYSDDDLKTTRHRECDGIIEFRPPDAEALAAIEQAWGIKFDEETKKWVPVKGSAPRSKENSE